MFPTFDYLIDYIFGTHLQWYFPPMFGFMVAVAFLCAAWTLSLELKRKEKSGLLKPSTKKVKVGEPAAISDLLVNGVFGFVIGWKVVGAIVDNDLFGQDPQGYLLSGHGNIIGGVVLGGIMAYLKYREKEKKRLPEPKEEEVLVHPYQLTGTITMVAAIWGIVGAKIFHQLEYWDEFIKDPAGNLFSTTGLTFYGGLIGGVIGVILYLRRHKLVIAHVADAVAPGLILAYAVGRIGCMLSGDGDWGIINSAYRIDDDRNYTVVAADSIHADLMPVYQVYGENPEEIDYAYFEKPSWMGFLPTWMVAFDFPKNVNEQGVPIAGCSGKYCNRLPLPVFPTAFYETIMGLLIFTALWLIRKRIHIPGMIFCIYLVLNGFERFFIEKIRVNSTIDFLGMKITQAELIAVILILVGIAGIIITPRLKNKLSKF